LLGRIDVAVQLELQRDLDVPKLEMEVICDSDGICPNCRSSGV